MKKQQIRNLPILVPKGNAFKIATPADYPKLHGVFVITGRRGSGKSYAAVSLLKHYQDAGCMDRVFVISPTIHSNKELLDLLKVDNVDFFDDPNKKSLDAVIDEINKEAKDYEEYHEKLKAYNKYKKFIEGNKGALFDDEILSLFDGEDFKKPEHRWNGKRPTLGLLIDDAQGSDLFKSNSKLMNFVIKHRHAGPLKNTTDGGALGVTIFICVQSYKAQGGGLPRAIRGNCTVLCVFKTKDEGELKDIQEEASGEVSNEDFLKVYNEAISEPYGFLMIDFNKKDNHPSMFRKRLNEFLILENK